MSDIENKGQKKKFKERIKHNYRLVIMEEDTFREITSYRLSILNVYVLISTMIVITAAVVISLIVFTPLKKYIPGYGSASANKELVRMNRQLEAMKEELVAQQEYTENFKRILTGDIKPMEEEQEEHPEFHDTLINVERIHEDEVLRREVELERIRENTNNNTLPQTKSLGLDQLYFTAPVNGAVSAAFNPKIEHFGVDILAPKNTPIKSIMDGSVIQANWILETGNTIAIQHENNLISFYKHNSNLLKKVGDRVKAGEAIAIIGDTGTLSDGPHLHLEIWHQSKPLNPEDFIIF